MTIVARPLLSLAFVPAEKGDVFWLPKNSECDVNRLKHLTAAGFLIRWCAETENSISGPLPIPLFKKLTNGTMTIADFKIIHPEAAEGLRAARDCYASGSTAGLYLKDGREVTYALFESYQQEQIIPVMVTDVSKAVAAFQRGEWLIRCFAEDLHFRVVAPAVINWDEMKDSCKMRGYEVHDQPIVLFWSVFQALSEDHKLKMLSFITGDDHAPATGFINHPIVIQRIQWDLVQRKPLPSSATCFRLLKLPDITDEPTMRRVIGICVEHSQGFGQS
jgi:hypothetical protein